MVDYKFLNLQWPVYMLILVRVQLTRECVSVLLLLLSGPWYLRQLKTYHARCLCASPHPEVGQLIWLPNVISALLVRDPVVSP